MPAAPERRALDGGRSAFAAPSQPCSGAPLGHSSIVAREYGIPAVLGTGVATRRIQSGQNVRIDGDAGTVMLLDGESATEHSSPDPGAGAPPNARRRAVGLALAAGAVLAAWLKWRKRS